MWALGSSACPFFAERRSRIIAHMSTKTTAAAAAPIKVLVIDDEAAHADAVADSLARVGYDCTVATTAMDGIAMLGRDSYEVIVTDLRMRDASGMDVLLQAKQILPDAEVIVVTGHGTVQSAVEAMQQGAFNYLLKPLDLKQLRAVVDNAARNQHLRRANAELSRRLDEKFGFEGIIGTSPAMQDLVDRLRRIAPTDATVLIQGETGTGKELIARTIHHNSPRANERFVAFNAAAIPEPLAEAELFGHAKGAFTGAVQARVGRFELAHRGTLFIDEVALMTMPMQAKLLRALQEKEIERVGESKSIKFDARIVAASNLDLKKLVKDGTFREDLYYRLHVIPITLPSLRDRKEDIPLLARHFVQKSCRNNNLPARTLTQDAMRALMNYSCPGNIRQLENAVEHAVAMTGAGTEIQARALPEDISAPASSLLLPTVAIPDEGINFTQVVSQLERELIVRCLEKTGGNKRQAARLLQLSRTTLIDKLNRLNVAAPPEDISATA